MTRRDESKPQQLKRTAMRARPAPACSRRRMIVGRAKARQNLDERPADLKFWLRNGFFVPYRARVVADTEVSIGRTNSKRALGFIVSRDKLRVDFVLNCDQVIALASYLEHMVSGLRKPLGRKPKQLEPAAFRKKPGSTTVRRRKK